MTIEQPTYDDLLASSLALLERVKNLEEALIRVRSLGSVGVWPAWEMGHIARDSLGPSHERKHQDDLTRLAHEYGV